jgi:hypothetical protein
MPYALLSLSSLIGTVAAATATAVASPQVIDSGKYHATTLQIKIA